MVQVGNPSNISLHPAFKVLPNLALLTAFLLSPSFYPTVMAPASSSLNLPTFLLSIVTSFEISNSCRIFSTMVSPTPGRPSTLSKRIHPLCFSCDFAKISFSPSCNLYCHLNFLSVSSRIQGECMPSSALTAALLLHCEHPSITFATFISTISYSFTHVSCVFQRQNDSACHFLFIYFGTYIKIPIG